MSILIVEDSPINAKIIESILQKNSYQTILALNGKEALEHLASTHKIQLVITDITMPEMDGLELLGKLKEQLEWKDIPVVMCTVSADIETVKKAKEAGCEHYLLKPVNKEHLLGKVREIMENEKPVLKDQKEMKSQLDLDEQSYQGIVHVFAALVSDQIAQLEKQIEGDTAAGNSIELVRLLEGAICFGAERIITLLEELSAKNEEMDKETRDSEYRLLLRELKILQDALPSPPPKKEPK